MKYRDSGDFVIIWLLHVENIILLFIVVKFSPANMYQVEKKKTGVWSWLDQLH